MAAQLILMSPHSVTSSGINSQGKGRIYQDSADTSSHLNIINLDMFFGNTDQATL